jgi:hypothetical protein
MKIFRRLRQALCSTVGHTWECWRHRRPDGSLRVLGYQCAHCRKFSYTRPHCIVSRIYE